MGCAFSAKSKWDRIGATSLKDALLNTNMISAAWLVDLADRGGTLPRCQDVPANAKVLLAEMEAWDDEFTVGALIISYPWLDRNHPDPHGDQLRKIAFVLRAFAAKACKYKGCRVGVFLDYCSLPQKNRDGVDDRTESDKARFKRALGGINAWYAHPKTTVLLVSTDLPTGHMYTNLQPYDGRGWCFAEKLMSAIVKDQDALIDLRKLDGEEYSLRTSSAITTTFGPGTSRLILCGKSDRPPPMAPDVFHDALTTGVEDESIKFTNRGDAEVVAGIYERAFLDEMSTATQLSYGEFGWGDERIATLSTALTFAHARGALAQLRELRLQNNQIGDDGMAALSAALASGAMVQLLVLRLYENCIGDIGLKAFSRELAKGALAQLQELWLYNNQIGDVGMRGFSSAVAGGALPLLRQLWLDNNLIGDDGVQALSEALARGANAQLRDLNLNRNQIGTVGVTALANAAASGGMPQCRHLWLKSNEISNTGMEVLASATTAGGLPKLETLHLSGNPASAASRRVAEDSIGPNKRRV